jgi:DNA-binding ferritin-like protein
MKSRLNTRNRRTKRNKMVGANLHYTNASKSHLVGVFLEMLNMVKLYHWKTQSFAQHKATDELYASLNQNVDRFIEVLLGKDTKRIQMMEKKIDLIDPANVTEFKTRIYEYREFLTDMNLHFSEKTDMDLLAIRDDLLADINQFLYLMTFRK